MFSSAKTMKSFAAMLTLAGVILGGCCTTQKPGFAVKTGEKFAFLGDSITAAGSGNRDGYCNLVMAGFKAMNLEVTPVFAGVCGHKSDDMLLRIDNDVIAQKPQWMTLSCGVNDIWHATMEGRKGVPLPEFRTNVETMVKKAQDNNIQVILMTATVVGEAPEQFAAQFAEYNQAIKEIAQKYNCHVADTGKAVRDELARRHAAGEKGGNLLTIDGVHMKREGDEVMAEAILRSVGADDQAMEKVKAAWQAIPYCEHK